MPTLTKTCLYLLCTALLLLNACKPENKPHPNIYKGPYYLGEVKDYLYFKTGSYWVYKNNVTNQIDTWTMTFIDTFISKTDMDLPDGHYYAEYTGFTYYQSSSLLNGILKHSRYKPTPHAGGVAIARKYIYESYPAQYDIFLFPFAKNLDTSAVYSPAPTFFKQVYNLQSGPYTFDSAVQLRVYDDIWPRSSIVKNSGVFADHFWVKGVGLSKIFIRSYYPETIETWELIDYKIIK
jgi:hypothetical protein